MFTASPTTAGQNQFISFSDQTSIYNLLHNQSISRDGMISSDYNEKLTSNVALGQFNTNGTAVQGDSGGAAYITSGGTDYVVGITSGVSTDRNNPSTTYTTLNAGNYYSALNAAQQPSSLPESILYGYDASEKFFGGEGHADIITDGNDDVVIAGSGGGIINGGAGTNTTIFLPASQGASDPGTSVVLGAGTDAIVGGGANDKLFIPMDRLTDATGGSAEGDSSQMLQLTGGITEGNNGNPGPNDQALDPQVYNSAYFDTDIDEASTRDQNGNDHYKTVGNSSFLISYGLYTDSDGNDDLTIDVASYGPSRYGNGAPGPNNGAPVWEGERRS